MKLFISWLSTREKENTFQLSSQYLLFLTYQDFNKFRQEDMIRMTKVPTAPTPSTTKPFPSHTSRSKTRPVFLSQYVDIFDDQIVIPLKQPYLTKMSLSFLHLQLWNLLLISLEPRKHLPEFTSHLISSSYKITRRSK